MPGLETELERLANIEAAGGILSDALMVSTMPSPKVARQRRKSSVTSQPSSPASPGPSPVEIADIKPDKTYADVVKGAL